MSKPKSSEAPSSAPEPAPSCHQNFRIRQVNRSEVRQAPYNPRSIGASERKRLKSCIQRVGLIEPPVWNSRTGNLVSGHQRVAILDQLEGRLDYDLTVAEVDLDPEEERQQNVLLNNPSAQGGWEPRLLSDLLQREDFDSDLAGLSPDDVAQFLDITPPSLEDGPPGTDDAATPQRNKTLVIVFQSAEERIRCLKAADITPRGDYVDGQQLQEALEPWM